jgi:hypothetical protein
MRSLADTTGVRLRYASIKRVALARTLASIAVVALLVLPSGAAAKGRGGPIDKTAAQQCAQERHAIGRRAFDRKYGTRHQMRSCVRRNRGRVRSAVDSASTDCQTELSQLGLAGFVDEYADEPTDPVSVAYDECVTEAVSEILDPIDGSDDDDTEDALD